MKQLNIFLLFLSLSVAPTSADPFTVRELWKGEFVQEMPPWRGPMELYVRYRSGEEDPRTFEGIITWPTLGNRRTAVQGTKSFEQITFHEVRCLDKSCGPVVLGGGYRGRFDEGYVKLRGEAQQSFLNLAGSFSLERVMGRDSSAEP